MKWFTVWYIKMSTSFFLVGVLICSSFAYGVSRRFMHENQYDSDKILESEPFLHTVAHGIKVLSKDAIELNMNLFSVDSVKVITGFMPAYIIARMQLDEGVHAKFYDPTCHRNKNQMNKGIACSIEKLAFAGVVTLSSFSFLGPTEETRIVGRVFGLGAISGLLAKRVIKEMRFKGGKRPWHQQFSREKRADGGFPSGHMFEASYMATVFGLQYGFKALLPLMTFGFGMFAVSINCNRHFVSQVVAGTGLGVMYGIAVHKVIQKRISEKMSFNIGAGKNGLPCAEFSYRF